MLTNKIFNASALHNNPTYYLHYTINIYCDKGRDDDFIIELLLSTKTTKNHPICLKIIRHSSLLSYAELLIISKKHPCTFPLINKGSPDKSRGGQLRLVL